MDRGKKALYNTVANAALQIVTVICGFILPRLILSAFGSSYNGIVASVTQFLSVIALLRAGVGGATRASLYKSLANKDIQQISATIKATEIFMRKIALIFLGFVLLFSAFYPYLVQSDFSWAFSASLVLIISISTFVQYFFGISYQILFQADQRQYITVSFEIAAIILNTIIASLLIRAGVGIHGVKLCSAAAFSITPIALNFLAKRQYKLDPKAKPDFSSINQRWDAFFHQLASFIHNNTDIVLLTVFSNVKIISVYNVYYMVAGGLRNVMNTLVTGVESAFGNILAKKEDEILKENLINVETMLHVIASFLFGAAIVLITPFVQVYTRGVTDISYTRYTFGYLALAGETLFVLRSPYEALVNAAGHFKQTKKFAFIEAAINITVSVVLVQFYDIIGVAIGTVAAILFRNIVYAVYASKVIVHRSMAVYIKRIIITCATIASTFILSGFLHPAEMTTYPIWILFAAEISAISLLLTISVNLLFYRHETIRMIKKITGIFRRVIKR